MLSESKTEAETSIWLYNRFSILLHIIINVYALANRNDAKLTPPLGLKYATPCIELIITSTGMTQFTYFKHSRCHAFLLGQLWCNTPSLFHNRFFSFSVLVIFFLASLVRVNCNNEKDRTTTNYAVTRRYAVVAISIENKMNRIELSHLHRSCTISVFGKNTLYIH